jgi:hypothetical protein
MTNIQRALWTFLIYALAPPFLGALVIVAFLTLVSALGLGDLLPENLPPLGHAALAAFVWAIVPAVLSALALAAVTSRNGTFSWIVAAAAAVVAFALAVMLFPIGLEDARPYLAFLSGVVAIAVREVLLRAHIITS